MSSVIERFLAAQPAVLQREALLSTRPDLAAGLRAWGAEWSALCAEVGLPCPPALRFLGDAMADRHIYFAFAGHAYSMSTPIESREERDLLSKLARDHAELASYAAMLPLFGQDGDSLLLDSEGCIHALMHDDWENAQLVAENLEDLLVRTTAAGVNL